MWPCQTCRCPGQLQLQPRGELVVGDSGPLSQPSTLAQSWLGTLPQLTLEGLRPREGSGLEHFFICFLLVIFKERKRNVEFPASFVKGFLSMYKILAVSCFYMFMLCDFEMLLRF